MAFDIITRGAPLTADEWLYSRGVPERELPPVSEEDRAKVSKGLITLDQARRRRAARERARKREEAEARKLGAEVESILAEIGSEYSLARVVRRGFESGWHLLISRNGGMTTASFDVAVPGEILGGGDTDEERFDRLDRYGLRSALRTELHKGEPERTAG